MKVLSGVRVSYSWTSQLKPILFFSYHHHSLPAQDCSHVLQKFRKLNFRPIDCLIVKHQNLGLGSLWHFMNVFTKLCLLHIRTGFYSIRMCSSMFVTVRDRVLLRWAKIGLERKTAFYKQIDTCIELRDRDEHS